MYSFVTQLTVPPSCYRAASVWLRLLTQSSAARGLLAPSNALSDCSATETTSDWRDRALCAGTDPAAFIPEKGELTRIARAVCTSYTVQRECGPRTCP